MIIADHWGQTLTAAYFFIGLPVGLFGGSGTLVTYAAQMAAFARDGGFPYKEKFSSVHPRLNQPIYTLALLVSGTSCILLFALSEKASSIIYSLSVVTGLVTFILPIILRLMAGSKWTPGPFSLGRYSYPNAVFAVLYTTYMIIMECFPTSPEFDAASMNYNSVLTVAAFAFSLGLYWFIGGKFSGPDQEALQRWRAARMH